MRDGAICSAVSFNRREGIPSGPVALFTSSCLKLSLSLDGGGCVFQTRVSGTREEQDGKDSDGCHDKDTEEE